MKKNAKMGILSLILWASLLTLLALAFCGERLDFPTVLSYAAPVLFCGFYILVFIAVKESRLRLFLFLAAGVALSLFLDRLNISRGLRLLAVFGILALYLLGSILYNTLQLRRALRPLNRAALAYQKDHDGEAFLMALDQYTPALPKGSIVKRDGIGTISMQEHFECERIDVLGNLGRLEERQELIERLRKETKSPGLLAWLDEKASEFGIDYP